MSPPAGISQREKSFPSANSARREIAAPRATYRFQFNAQFPLPKARELVPYLAELGISHVYASPLLKACPGSTHGYDTCDFEVLNPELGTENDLKELHEELERHSMALILDIVPNHMGVASLENRWWRDVLIHGQASRYSGCFDIDWRSTDPRITGKLVLPILGDRYQRELERGAIRLTEHRGALHLLCGETMLPVSPSTLATVLNRYGGFHSNAVTSDLRAAVEATNTDPGKIDQIVRMQNYAPVYWRVGETMLNYRRFFTITSLAGIRIEDARVFNECFATVKQWLQKGWVNGLRVDHIDGLRNPVQFLQRLRDLAPRSWIVVEKILEPDEELCRAWPIQGTTGYDFLNDVYGLFVDPRGEKPLTEFYAEFTGDRASYADLIHQKKRRIIDDNFAAETNRLTDILLQISSRQWPCRDFSREELRQGWTEVAISLPVYRTYIGTGQPEVTETDTRLVRDAVELARKNHPGLATELPEFLEKLLLFGRRGTLEDDFVLRLQQLTGAITAKAVEDTAFYCYNRFIALNEVGADPSRFGVAIPAFHEICRRRQQRWPTAMNSLSTHDTKRGADVRARLALLSQMPQQWPELVRKWSTMNAASRTGEWPDRKTEYFLYQTLVGAWPVAPERVLEYMQKAVREAKEHTDWQQPVPEYENALKLFIERIFTNSEFIESLKQFVATLEDDAIATSLAQTLIHLTAPGLPDIYQGGELWDLSLADPDNRRTVDFAARKEMFAAVKTLDASGAMQQRPSGMPKLWLISKVLEARRHYPDCFGAEGDYTPLAVLGANAENVVTFGRGEKIVVIAPRLIRGLNGNWQDTSVELPSGNWRNALTGEEIKSGNMRELTAKFPVALLIREN